MAAARVVVAAVAAAAVVGRAGAMFPDQAGVLDRSVRHIGPPSTLYPVPAASDGGAAAAAVALVLTDANVAALLHLRSHEYLWRYVATAEEELVGGAVVPTADGGGAVALVLVAGSGGVVARAHAVRGGGRLVGELHLPGGADATVAVAAGAGAAAVVGADGSITTLAVTAGGVAVAGTVGALALPGNRDGTLRPTALAYVDGTLYAACATTAAAGGSAVLLRAADRAFVRVGGVAAAAAGVAAVAAVDGRAVLVALSADGATVHTVAAPRGGSGGKAAAAAVAAVTLFEPGAVGAAGVLTLTSLGHTATPSVLTAATSTGRTAVLSLAAAGSGAPAVRMGVSADGSVEGESRDAAPPGAVTVAGVLLGTPTAVAAVEGGVLVFSDVGHASPDVAMVPVPRGSAAAGSAAEWLTAAALDTATHGAVVRAFGVVTTPKGGAAAPVRRLVTVQADGWTTAFSAGGVAWAFDEGGACVAQALELDVAAQLPAAAAAAGGGDVRLTLAARLADQGAAVGAALAQLRATLTQPADLVARLTPAWLARGAANGTAHGNVGGVIAPLLPGARLTKLAVTRRALGVAAGAAAQRGRCSRRGAVAAGAVVAEDFESGAVAWRLPLPAAPALVRRTGATATLLLSRPRPLQAHAAELLLVESAPDAGGGGGVTTAFTWVDAQDGTVRDSRVYHGAHAPSFVSRLPLVQDGSDRDVYAVYFAPARGAPPSGAVVVPADAAVVAAVAQLADTHVVAATTYDAAACTEGVAGYVLRATVLRHGMGVAAVAQLWHAALATGGDRLLAFGATAHGGGKLARAAGAGSASTPGDALTGAAVAALDDAAHVSPAQILGDDALLLKYLNPNVAYVAVGPAGPRAGAFDATSPRAATPCTAGAEGAAPTPAPAPGVTLYLLDIVSGRVLHARRHAAATGPVAAVKHENWVVYSYWNSRSSRPELGVAALYEGFIDTHELTPWNKAPLSVASGSTRVAAHGQQLPIVLHRSYVLPVSVNDIATTKTRYGMTTTHILFTTAANGVLMVDKRLLDPRRPSKEPTEGEKAEGLAQYSPVLPLRHAWLLTYSQAVEGVTVLHAAPSTYESTTLVSALGVDHFRCRTAPVRPFDQLDSEYNRATFAVAIGVVVVAMLVLRRRLAASDAAAAWK